MLSDEKMKRLNELAKKSKTATLSTSEIKEQQILREEYLRHFRKYFKKRLENITFVDNEGNEINVQKKNIQ